jgi:hypothetical protein
MRGDIVEYGEIPCGRERKVVCWLAHFAEVYGASVGVPEYRASLALDQLPKLFAGSSELSMVGGVSCRAVVRRRPA